jgi:hypothetical protein
MAVDTNVVVMLLSNDVTKFVFREVAKNRSVLFKQLRESLDKTPELQANPDKFQLEAAVKMLKDADLIKERTAPIEDFKTYYVTANGLTAERQLRLAEAV